MPLPPPFWSNRDVDEHWEDGHRFIAEEILRLKEVHSRHLQLARIGRQFINHFGFLHQYDRELIVGSFQMMLLQDDDILALTDGLWLPGIAGMPPSLSRKRIPVHTPYFRRACQAAWLKALLAKPVSAPPTHQKSDLQKGLRFRILRRDNYRCQLCGASTQNTPEVCLEVDHIRPRSKGGSNHPDNLTTLCFACNRGKGNDDA